MSYDAFISYAHRLDGVRAAALQRALQNLAKPFYAWKALNVFRDQTSLSANPALWPSIEGALGKSRFFVFMACPESADASPWCHTTRPRESRPQRMAFGRNTRRDWEPR